MKSKRLPSNKVLTRKSYITQELENLKKNFAKRDRPSSEKIVIHKDLAEGLRYFEKDFSGLLTQVKERA